MSDVMASFDRDDRKDPSLTVKDESISKTQPRALTEDGTDYCRICRGEATDEQPLFYPCKCSGSIKYVHQDCLMEWLSHSQKKYCELCKTPFRFTKLYHQSMPPTIPYPLFLRQVVFHAGKAISRWLRYLIVGVIWLCCLPWCIRHIWRGLFWLADGSWVSESELRDAVSANSGFFDANMSSPLTNYRSSSNLGNDTFVETAGSTIGPVVASVTELLRFLSGETLLLKAMRLLVTSVQSHNRDSTTTDSMNGTLFQMSGTRESSLLSDVQLLRSLSPYPRLNNIFIDILEGQLICILLIAAFILVFLIREWVINQQPILNMPDAEAPENPLPAQQNNEGRQVRRLRRRGVPREMDGTGEADAETTRQDDRPIATPRPRRAVTDDNVASHDTNRIERPIFPERSSSSRLADNSSDIDSGGEFHFDEIFEGHQDASTSTSPPPLMRGALGQAMDIHRSIEEAFPSNDPQDAPQPIFSDQQDTVEQEPDQNTIGEKDHQFDSTQNSMYRLPTSDFSFGSPSNTSWPVQHDTSAAQDKENNRTPLNGSIIVNKSAENVVAKDESADKLFKDPHPISASIADVRIALNNTLDENDFESDIPIPTAPTSIEDDLDLESTTRDSEESDHELELSQPTGDMQQIEHSFLDTVAAWLWHTDEYIPEANLADLQDDEHIVRNLHAEAPFVPVQNRAVQRPEPAVAEPQPAAREPNIQFGIDLNDPNGADDVEDLDGILELIGMEGPITGMVQNVIFSLFLIVLTLAASIWVPYIWGKIALLFMANPIIVFVKAPLYLVSKGADVLADVLFFAAGFTGIILNALINLFTKMVTPILPNAGNFVNTTFIEQMSVNIKESSGNRLEKTFTGTFLGLRPDLPTFSMQSQHALRVFKAALATTVSVFSSSLSTTWNKVGTETWTLSGTFWGLLSAITSWRTLSNRLVDCIGNLSSAVRSLSSDLHPLSFRDTSAIDFSLIEWNTQDKIIAIVLGYTFFAFVGVLFLKLTHFALGLKEDEKVEGSVADTLRQAGGVMKVIVIIGIEMIVFPLYCGLLLDLALLPLFANASLGSRLSFLARAPFTGMFVHWFIGTCYMFHFALFVSMCRKIMRKGVLYFIRDPDDPTFHPVRDVLERPVPNQLGKIAFSALVYGGLVILCLGGVVGVLSRVPGVFPIHWAAIEPRLAFPVDVVFFNLILPFLIRKAEPSKKVAALFEWWFRKCARSLRISHFLFGDERPEEKTAHGFRAVFEFFGRSFDATGLPKDGTYVRAPASDSVRIPKGQKVFVEVNDENERVDGKPDQDKGLHGKNDERFDKIYIPSNFRLRIAGFILMLWLFAATTGVASTIGPLVIGRLLIRLMSGSVGPFNDLYALTIGLHICALMACAITYGDQVRGWMKQQLDEWFTNSRSAMSQIWAGAKYTFGLLYLGLSLGVVLPFAISLFTELYIHVPVFTFLMSRSKESLNLQKMATRPVPTIFVLQTWTLGLLYMRLALRVASRYPSTDTRLAMAMRAITRDGLLRPDVRLASRAVILPATLICILLLALPLGYAKMVIVLLGIQQPDMQMQVYRFAFPGLLSVAIVFYGLYSVKRQINIWRIKIRDEVYLIGERLHNFQEVKGTHRQQRAIT